MFCSLGALALAIAPVAGSIGEDTAREDTVWYADFDVAAAAAKEQGKDLFVDFTGSDWCGWCIKLDDEVFAHDEFLTAAREQYVLVKLDYPRGEEAKAKVPNPDRNEELQAKYGIRGFPTVLLMTHDGIAFAQTGYQAGGPEAYVEHMGTIRTEGRAELAKVEAAIETFEQAGADAKVAAWEGVVALLEEVGSDSPFTGRLVPLVREAFTLDPTNEQGLKLRAVSQLIDLGIYDADIRTAAFELDPRNEEGLIEKALYAQMRSIGSEEDVAAFVEAVGGLEGIDLKDPETAFSLFGNAAMFCDRYLDDADGAVAFAKKALAIGNEDPDAQRFVKMLRDLVGEEAEEEDAGGQS